MTPPGVDDPPAAVETRALSRRFGAVEAVREVALRVPAGTIYGLLGPNGAGKTTLLRLVLGLLRPDAGEVRLFGRPLAEGRVEALARVGAMVEAPAAYPHLTGEENLETTRRMLGLPRAATDEALARTGLEELRKRRAGTYSAGTRQRLGLARALLARPALLVLDEPASTLDPEWIRRLRDLLRELCAREGTTVLMSSHLLAEVEQVADVVGVLDGGRLRFQGPLSALGGGAPTLRLSTGDPARARALLAAAFPAAAVEGGGADGALRLSPADRETAARANALLVENGVAVWHLALEAPGLEARFLALVGGRGEAEA